MSASNPTVYSTGSAGKDIWRQHELQIRDLYQNKKKTLKEVKEDMEKNGFPKKPLSTWESKLRVDLRIRKKNKANHWPLVYRHLAPRLEMPGKKRLRRPTSIRLDGNEISFHEAWKEIRRSGAHKLSPRLLPQGSLPDGVEVRTPSPILSQHSMTENLASSSASVVPTSIVPPTCGPTATVQLHPPQTTISGGPLRDTPTTLTFLNDIPTTPWVSICANLRHIFHDAMPVRILYAWKSLEWWKIVPMGRSLGVPDLQSQLDLLPATSPGFPRPSPDLGYRLASSRGNISLSEFVSTSIYLLSNRLYDQNDGDKGLQLLCYLFEHDVPLLTQILQSELSTGRAAWESLFKYSQHHGQKLIFSFLVDFGIRHEWLDFSDIEIIVTALEMDSPTGVVEGILNLVCRSGHSHWRYILDAILIAYRKGYLGVANSLVQRFDINAEVPCCVQLPNKKKTPLSVFLAFVLEFNAEDSENWDVLEFFLRNGADVDKVLPSRWYTRLSGGEWYYMNEINRALRPTILDHSFRLSRPLFNRLAQNSKVPETKLTKTGLLISLENGLSGLRDYLRTRVTTAQHRNVRSALEFLLNDQCHPKRWQIHLPVRYMYAQFSYSVVRIRRADLKTLCSLVEYGVDWHGNSKFLPDIHHLLDEVLCHLRENFTDDGLQLFNTLVHKGADIRESHLEGAVELKGTKFLNWLQPRVKDFPAKAAMALAKAALLNNFEAVEFILRAGADPNALINARSARLLFPRKFVVRDITSATLEQAYSVQAIAAGVGKADNFEYPSLRMYQILAEKGASLVVGPNDRSAFAFAMLLLEHGWGDNELFAKIKFCIHMLKQNKHWETPPSVLLELCLEYRHNASAEDIKERLKIFEYLLSEGVDVTPGSPLAAVVQFGGPEELVHRVLRMGARIDAYISVSYWGSIEGIQTALQAAASRGNEDFVHLLLQEGANVNIPARGESGRTALQAICSWSPATEEEHHRKMAICEILLNSGADINAAPSRLRGMTALQAAVTTGDLELTALLVRKGAHVNAPPGNGKCCALDAAARYGRLDIAKLLLESNALSANLGMTGYDGAIELAEQRRHNAIASMVRDHIGNGVGPVLNISADDYHIYGYNTDREYSDEDPWDTSDSSSTDGSWSPEDEEPSKYDSEYSSTSESDSSTNLRPHAPEDAQAIFDSPVVENILRDDFMGYMETGADLTMDGVDVDRENEPRPDPSMGSLTDTLGGHAIPDLQVVPNAAVDDWISHSGTGFNLPAEDTQLPGTEWMLDNPFEPWAGMSQDGAFWQQVFEMQHQEFGFPT